MVRFKFRFFENKTKLVIVFFIAMLSSGDAKASCSLDQISIGVDSNKSFFGFNSNSASGITSLQGNCKNISIGLDVHLTDEKISHHEFVSYSYATEQAIFSVGVENREIEILKQASSFSIFFEIEGRQEVLGLIPELHFSKSINRSSHDYLNLRLGKEIYQGDYLINPYAEFAMGSIFSDAFQSNNILLGVDVVTPIGGELYLSPYTAINIPLSSIKEFDTTADPSIEIGIALRKDF